MTTSSFDQEVEAARAYESLFVPAVFGQFAAQFVRTAGIQEGDRVLDVACGTGVLARAAASMVGPGGFVAGLDPGAGMIAVAGEAAPQVDWRRGSAESMPFANEEFDVVVSQFGLMFMDEQAALREMLRVLRPQGRLVVAVWDSLERNPAYAAEVALLEAQAGKPAADALRAPFVLGDAGRLAELLESAGAASAIVEEVPGRADFPSVRVMVEADLRGGLPVMNVCLEEDQIDQILGRAEIEMANYVSDDGRANFDVQALVATATKPS